MENFNFSSSFSADTICLHDTNVEIEIIDGGKIELKFNNGFNVLKDNPCNHSGRALQTGKAIMFLENAEYRKGTIKKPFPPDIIIPEGGMNPEYRFIPENEVTSLKIMIDYFIFSKESGLCYISGSNTSCSEYKWMDIELTVNCSDINCFWNEYIGDSWLESEMKHKAAESVMEASGLSKLKNGIYYDVNNGICYRFLCKNEAFLSDGIQRFSDQYVWYHSSDVKKAENGIFNQGQYFDEDLTVDELQRKIRSLL